MTELSQFFPMLCRSPSKGLSGRAGAGLRPLGVALLAAGLLLGPPPLSSAQEDTVFDGHEGIVYCLAFSPTGDMLVSGGGDDLVKFWRFETSQLPDGELERRRQLILDLDDDQFDVRQAAFKKLALVGRDVQPMLVDSLASVKTTDAKLRIRYLLAAMSAPVGQAHREEIRGVAFSPDGHMVVSASGDNTIICWRVSSGRPVLALKGHADGAWSVAYSPDGKVIASSGGDHMIRLWDTKTGELIGSLAGHESTIHRVAFSPDGRWLASAGSFDRTVRLWDVRKQTLRATLGAHDDAVLSIAFSPDGKQLASSGYGGTVRLWRVADGQSTATINTRQGIVRALAFVPHSGRLATGGDRLVRLWELEPPREVASYLGDSEQIYTLACSPAGDRLAAGGKDGVIRCWNLRK